MFSFSKRNIFSLCSSISSQLFFFFSSTKTSEARRKKINLFNKAEHIGCCAGGINCSDLHDNLCIGVNFFAKNLQFIDEIWVLPKKIPEKRSTEGKTAENSNMWLRCFLNFTIVIENFITNSIVFKLNFDCKEFFRNL